MNLSVVKKYLTPKSILDIGANVGQFYSESLNEFPDSYYYLIEGNDYCEKILGGLNVDYSISLLSSEKKIVDFYMRKHNLMCTGSSIYRENTNFYNDEEILIIQKATNTVDELLGEKTFDLIKIVVQGSEIDIIEGGINLIKKSQAIILEVSLCEYNLGSPNKEEVYKYMDELGFYPVEVIGTINHPTNHTKIQEDVLFLKKEKIALMTVIFDYPEHFEPSFYKNALKYFKKEDIHILRLSDLVTNGSYYDKLFYYKVFCLLEYILTKIKGKYDYILFLDATDTNFIFFDEKIVEKFKKKNCSILFGAEYGLWPVTNFTHLYEKKPKITDKIYLNSGTYFGYTDKIIYHLDDIIHKKYQEGIDDQGRWTIQYLLNDDILLDQECEFFFSTFLSKKDVIITESGPILDKKNAFIVHDNGPHNEETIKLTDLLR
jgi:FkbM family methyltransferase